ncbi:lipid-A-disaccharide synthase [Marinicella litoralis]|uniref:Lipid-A-disaccharide synthase n=1 Tax=Marinicella litoralis TaxID=644220 RepID=A0A4R6XM84_9GAMM|nr:lipid-A-disaccharide synthase [Marinicella litoralis]TDR19469.1 lipid-A-disaccharide synthase [Marinicella litoralis]
MPKPVFKIALVAGEASSDMIGADLIRDLQRLHSDLQIIAVGGDKIKQTQAVLIQDNEVFSVMGLAEVLKDLPRLLKIKKQIVKDIVTFEPDVFIGVDSPDLNFSIAKSLKKLGIPTVHYVSPSVWAWRPKRVYKMAEYIECLLTLFPFEPALYKNTSIQAEFVGHPLAKSIPLVVDKVAAKEKINASETKVLAVLPGSRNREINKLMPIFCDAIKHMQLSGEWTIYSSNVNRGKIDLVQSIAVQHGVKIEWVSDTTALLKSADFALLGSGTVALEAMLCKTPMVVAYQISAMTWFIVNTFKMMQLPYYSLPNVLFGDFLVPEVMQNNLTVENLSQACLKVINQQDSLQTVETFTQIHQSLLAESPNQAALTVMAFMENKC